MQPPVIFEGQVEPAWIDYNGHMNVAYYVLVFDLAIDGFLDQLGLGEAYRTRTGCTVFTLELHVSYQRELKLNEQLQVSLQLLDHDQKRVHCFLRMHHVSSGEVAATMEQLFMHMDTATGRSARMTDEVLARLERLASAHVALPAPAERGARIGIRRR